MVSCTTKDWSHSPSSGPRSIPSSAASRSASISGETSVEPWISPADCATTRWATSNTAITILNVLDRMRMAQAVLNIHLKKIQ